jgi:hypothetical protein
MFVLHRADRVNLDCIENGPLDGLYRYWSSRCGGKVMPLRDDVDLLDIRDDNVGRMHMLRVEGPRAFRYLLYGGRVTNPDRVDMTGKTTQDYQDRAFGAMVTDHLAGTVEEQRALCYHVRAAAKDRPYEYIRLVMPLGDARVEYLWVGTQRILVDPAMDRRKLY